jgi:hypothetical protein
MFGILNSIVKAAAVVIDVPVAVVSDVVTLGGALNDKNKTYTEKAVSRFVGNIEDIADPKK